MPMYQCFTPQGSLDDEQRSAIASAFTDIHCSLTTAPPTFVHVLFHERRPKWSPTDHAIHGGIRAGRPQDVTDSLIAQMTSALAEAAAVSPDAVTMQTRQTPASWIMEGGAVLPEPGEEAAWVGAQG